MGGSPALKKSLSQARTVAPSEATVLILGETGTGKELIARAIHRMSPRKDRAYVKLNCAAIPTGLLESELFGHQRGAFTGAITQKSRTAGTGGQGKLFLDEVGDIPLELQPKLLRRLRIRSLKVGEHSHPQGGHTLNRGYQPEFGPARVLKGISQRPLLSSECVSHPHAAVD